MYGNGFKPVLYFHANFCYVVISDPKVVEDMYTSKNKYMSKHRLFKDAVKCLAGNTIVSAETSKEWKESR